MRCKKVGFVAALASLLAFGCAAKESGFAGKPEKAAREEINVEEGAILHCFSWSFKTIEANAARIARAGFRSVQTSPASACLVGEGGGMELFGKGKWYYHYQPTDFTIGNYQLGTREDFASMCSSLKKEGVAVIVDVVANHTTPTEEAVSPALIRAAGGKDKLYHKTGHRPITNWLNRFEVTNYQMGGLPDIDTENPFYQKYLLTYLNELIELGAEGFRFDAAKHIALPDDRAASEGVRNNFWLVMTGREDADGARLKNAGKLFIYGEVLQDSASREAAYGSLIAVTASNYGKILRSSLKAGRLFAKGLADFRVKAPHFVTWVESHDTYANEGESAALSNFSLRAGYALIAARRGGTPLFFSRPKGDEGVQFPRKADGTTYSKIGDAGNDEFMHPEVRAINEFRIVMRGEDEELINGEDDSLICIKRGKRGAVLINIAKSGKAKVAFPTGLSDGKYTDTAHSLKFKVKGGFLTGTLPAETVAVIY